MDATLDAKFLEHRTKMSISKKESTLATWHALEKLIQGLPESAIIPRASITIQLDQLAAQLARVDQTLEHDTTSQNTTQDVMVHIHETLQMTVAPLLALKDNLEHLHQKIDSLENTIDERLPSGTHILNAGHINDRTGLANAGDTDDADHTSWATPDGCQTIYPDDDAATITTAARLAGTISPPTPYGTPYFSNHGSREAPSRYPAPFAPPAPAEVESPPPVPAEVAPPPPVLAEVESPPPVPAEVAPPPPVLAAFESTPTVPAKVESPPPVPVEVASPRPGMWTCASSMQVLSI
jgi:hypothetical protein